MESKLESMVKELTNTWSFQQLKRDNTVSLHLDNDGIIIHIKLHDEEGKLVDVFDIKTNSEGFVHPGEVIYYIVLAWQLGLSNSEWNESLKRVRKMKF